MYTVFRFELTVGTGRTDRHTDGPKPFDTLITQARKQTLPPSDRTLYYTSASV